MNISVGREDINEKIQSMGNLLQDGASMIKLYPVLKEATSSSAQPAPGYLFQIIIDFSWKGKKNSEMLGDYLNRRLGRPSPHAKLKTLKCVQHLVEKGSPKFRQYLRSNDDQIRNATSLNFSAGGGGSGSTESLQGEVGGLAKTILRDLFNEERVEEDNSGVGDREAGATTSGQVYAGMGSHTKNSQGFGGSGGDRSSHGGLTSAIRDVVEQIVYAPDPKQELLQSCLRSSVGDYQPVTVEFGSSPTRGGSGASLGTKQNRPFVPGRAGGGWDEEGEGGSSSEDELSEFYGLYQYGADQPSSPDKDLKESEEFSGICAFCRQTSSNNLHHYDALLSLVNTLESGHKATILQALQHMLTTENGETLLNTLILLEILIQKELLPCHIVDLSLRTGLELKRLDSNKNIAVKSSKILATLDFIKNYKLPVL